MIRQAQRRGLAHEAADRIRDAILDGTFPPGSAIREVELAESLEVSRGSVREGLAVLEREGLVHSVWHKGTTVIELTESDIDEVYAVRAALDRLAATTAAAKPDRAGVDELDRLVDTMAAETGTGADGARLLELDLEFHDLIYRLAGNRRLTDAWQAVRSQVHLFQANRIRLDHDHYQARVVAEHRELAALIRAGDTGALAVAAEDHVHTARAALIRRLKEPS